MAWEAWKSCRLLLPASRRSWVDIESEWARREKKKHTQGTVVDTPVLTTHKAHHLLPISFFHLRRPGCLYLPPRKTYWSPNTMPPDNRGRDRQRAFCVPIASVFIGFVYCLRTLQRRGAVSGLLLSGTIQINTDTTDLRVIGPPPSVFPCLGEQGWTSLDFSFLLGFNSFFL